MGGEWGWGGRGEGVEAWGFVEGLRVECFGLKEKSGAGGGQGACPLPPPPLIFSRNINNINCENMAYRSFRSEKC